MVALVPTRVLRLSNDPAPFLALLRQDLPFSRLWVIMWQVSELM